jgi:hypothetical protein
MADYAERIAQEMIAQYGDLAAIEAAKRACALVDSGDLVAGAIWANITNAIRELNAPTLRRTHRADGANSN